MDTNAKREFNQLLTTGMQSFQNFMRMDFVAFEELLSRVEARLIKQQTRMSQSISPRERLCIAVRYLATGNLCNFAVTSLIVLLTIYLLLREINWGRG